MHFGMILDQLHELGIENETLVVVTGDHGSLTRLCSFGGCWSKKTTLPCSLCSNFFL